MLKIYLNYSKLLRVLVFFCHIGPNLFENLMGYTRIQTHKSKEEAGPATGIFEMNASWPRYVHDFTSFHTFPSTNNEETAQIYTLRFLGLDLSPWIEEVRPQFISLNVVVKSIGQVLGSYFAVLDEKLVHLV